jgi:peptidoglycan/xylan/chitin deacetylase (PgdA/CDA1 family)
VYHRVAEPDVDPWVLSVSAQHFAEHLDVLQKEARPIGLGQLVQAHMTGNIPDRAVAVTFDDGYADNLHSAKPLLERHTIPATVFVTSGRIGHEREFWWDELEQILLYPGKLPQILTLNINSRTFRSELNEAADYGKDQFLRDFRWNVGWPQDPTRRHSLYRTLHPLIQSLREAEQRKVIDALLAWSGVKLIRRPSRRVLSNDELLALGQSDLIEIGAHTVTHALLSELPESLQQDEIRQSKLHLEEKMGRPVRCFAYPYGSYTRQTVTLAQEAGFECACSTIDDSVWRGSDRFQLPRVTVEDWDGETFAKRLRQMFH